MANESKRCVYTEFCVKLGKSAIETFEMIKTAFEIEALKLTKTSERRKRFLEDFGVTGDDSPVPVDPRLLEIIKRCLTFFHFDAWNIFLKILSCYKS